MKNFIKEHKTEIAIVGGALVIGILAGYKIGSFSRVVTQFTNSTQDLIFKANPNYDSIDLFKRTKDGLDHLWVIDYGDAQILSADLVEAMSELHPA